MLKNTLLDILIQALTSRMRILKVSGHSTQRSAREYRDAIDLARVVQFFSIFFVLFSYWSEPVWSPIISMLAMLVLVGIEGISMFAMLVLVGIEGMLVLAILVFQLSRSYRKISTQKMRQGNI